jgi:DNA polymerase beta
MDKKQKKSKIENKKNQKLYDKFVEYSRYIQNIIDNTEDKSEQRKQQFRLRYIILAGSIIKNHPYIIKSGEDLNEYSGIGKGIKGRVKEILETGTLKELENSVMDKINERFNVIQNLTGVHGIGRKLAQTFIQKHGIKNITELKKKIKSGEIEVGDKLKIGLKYHNKFKTNIPRKEIDIVNDLLKDIISKIDKDLVFKIAGSYRRGKETSNDIDVLLSSKKIKTKAQYEKSKKNYLMEVVKKLKNKKFLIDDLTDDTREKYMGFSKLKGKPVRRFDMIFIPYSSYPAALLYFTGSYQLNTIMRNKAKQMGLRLNQNGLFECKEDKLKLIKTGSEKSIFKKLGMEYLEPTERNIN